MLQFEQLVGGAIRKYVGIEVDNLGELRLLPEINLGEGGMQLGAVHQVQIGGLAVAYARNRQDAVVDGLVFCQLTSARGLQDAHLELRDGVGRHGIEGY